MNLPNSKKNMADVVSNMVLGYYDKRKSLEAVIKRKSGIEMIVKSKNRRKKLA